MAILPGQLFQTLDKVYLATDPSYTGEIISIEMGQILIYLGPVRIIDRLDLTWHALMTTDRVVYISIPHASMESFERGEDVSLVPYNEPIDEGNDIEH